MTEEQWLADNGYELKDGKLTRYVTKGQFDKVVTGAIAPTTMSRDLVNSLDGFRKTGATDEGYFDKGQTSLDFQQNINKDNLKTLMHEPLLGGESWADQVLKDDGTWDAVEAALYAKIPGAGANGADTDGDGTVSKQEQIAAREFMFNELEKEENADLIKKEIGDWWASKAEAHFNDGKDSVVNVLSHSNQTRQGTRAGGNQGGVPNSNARN